MMITRFPLRMFFCLGALFAPAVPASAAVVTIDPATLVSGYISLGEWNTNGNLDNWVNNPQVINSTVSGGLFSRDVNDGDNDPQLTRSNFSGLEINLDSGNYDVIEVRISRTGTPSRFDIFWGTTAANGIAGARRVDDQSMLPSDSSFHIIQIDMSGEAGWTSTLDDMRIDPFSGTAAGGRSLQIDYVRVGMVVPEPSSAALVGLGSLSLIFRRRRK